MDNVDRQSVSDAWSEAAQDALNAARELKERAHYRSSVSRAYYAAYAFLAAAMVAKPGVSFADGRDGPQHGSLPDLVKSHLAGDLGRRILWNVRTSITALYEARLVADYRPRVFVNRDVATDALRRAGAIANAVKRDSP